MDDSIKCRVSSTCIGSTYFDDLTVIASSKDAVKPFDFDVNKILNGAWSEVGSYSYTDWYRETGRSKGSFTIEFNALDCADPKNEWKHVCVTKRDSAVVLYVNGVAVKGVFDREGYPITDEEIEKEMLLHEIKEEAKSSTCRQNRL